ncbi:ubiquinone/menaquinone biosynthesis C-methylase UbiE [Deinococcus sp. HSC-46F16]|uniref:class I SAM-dependent methyltransferase n=1 Tax=Deinococcus sp. HSC-46F16 TaxID=2910968 RepID=UPI00209EFF92|nr:methyltransferase domain-containing protein [Deinococcus sp. HSC-46F16]MCP2013550.1 ubiquinone/menaquinone biosynthesis C-methylase UbiE [Deinococcus sp. HSC-46F16]
MGAYDRLAATYDRQWGRSARTTAREVLAALPPVGIGTLLDVGCGTGTLLALARERFPDGRLIGAEPSAGMRGVAARTLTGRGVTLLACPAEALALPDASVDALTCLNVLHYLADPLATLREWRRVLRPSGILVLQDYVPNGLPGFARLAALNDRALVRVYTVPELAALLEAAGFREVTARPFRIDLFWRGGLARGLRP